MSMRARADVQIPESRLVQRRGSSASHVGLRPPKSSVGAAPQGRSTLDDRLPDEIIVQILGHLDPTSLVHAARTSTAMRRLCTDVGVVDAALAAAGIPPPVPHMTLLGAWPDRWHLLLAQASLQTLARDRAQRWIGDGGGPAGVNGYEPMCTLGGNRWLLIDRHDASALLFDLAGQHPRREFSQGSVALSEDGRFCCTGSRGNTQGALYDLHAQALLPTPFPLPEPDPDKLELLKFGPGASWLLTRSIGESSILHATSAVLRDGSTPAHEASAYRSLFDASGRYAISAAHHLLDALDPAHPVDVVASLPAPLATRDSLSVTCLAGRWLAAGVRWDTTSATYVARIDAPGHAFDWRELRAATAVNAAYGDSMVDTPWQDLAIVYGRGACPRLLDLDDPQAPGEALANWHIDGRVPESLLSAEYLPRYGLWCFETEAYDCLFYRPGQRGEVQHVSTMRATDAPEPAPGYARAAPERYFEQFLGAEHILIRGPGPSEVDDWPPLYPEGHWEETASLARLDMPETSLLRLQHSSIYGEGLFYSDEMRVLVQYIPGYSYPHPLTQEEIDLPARTFVHRLTFTPQLEMETVRLEPDTAFLVFLHEARSLLFQQGHDILRVPLENLFPQA